MKSFLQGYKIVVVASHDTGDNRGLSLGGQCHRKPVFHCGRGGRTRAISIANENMNQNPKEWDRHIYLFIIVMKELI